MQNSNFVNPDGSPWTPQQIQAYYAQWAQVNTQYQQYATNPYQQYLSLLSNPYQNQSSSQPTYASVVQKSNDLKRPIERDTEWPESLKNFVSKTFAKTSDKNRPKIELKLKQVIQKAQDEKRLWSIDWEHVTLEEPRSVEYKSVKKLKKQKSNNSPSNSPKLEKKLQILDEDDSAKLQRKARFDQEQRDELHKMRKKQTSPPRRTLKDLNPDTLDWNDQGIVGTCAELEKSYLRLTAAPDPSTVRPLKILKKTLEMLKMKWKREQNYTYICDQFKSLRQDLTVQRIKNEFTVQVYETHSRIAIEKVFEVNKGDLGEFNQCSAQLQQLYTLHNLPGHEDELTAYRILYMIHTLNKRELIELIGSLQKRGPFVQHALQVRSSISTGDYPTFFKLYHTCPNMGAYLMDHFLERERLKTFLKLVRVYRPTLTVKFLATALGFTLPDEPLTKMTERDTVKWIQGLQVPIANGIIDCKVASGIVAQHVNDVASKGVDIKGQIH